MQVHPLLKWFLVFAASCFPLIGVLLVFQSASQGSEALHVSLVILAVTAALGLGVLVVVIRDSSVRLTEEGVHQTRWRLGTGLHREHTLWHDVVSVTFKGFTYRLSDGSRTFRINTSLFGSAEAVASFLENHLPVHIRKTLRVE